MKPTNLYLIYRNVKQRIRTGFATKSVETQRKAVLMVAAAERLLEKPSLELVKEFRKVEDLWRLSSDVSISAKSLANQFETAIRSRCFVVERPTLSTVETGYNPSLGVVYCASSSSKVGQLKIGVTTMKLKARLQKMMTRYGLADVRPVFSIAMNNPAVIESQTKKRMRESLVSGKTEDDSNEWYRISATEFVKAIVETIQSQGNSVYEVTLFDDSHEDDKIKSMLGQLGPSVTRASIV